MRVLVTGGAGYVGSHCVRHLAAHGHAVWTYDNLTRGHRAAVAPSQLIVGDLADRELLADVLRDKRIDAVLHLAAFTAIGESVEQPGLYYGNNVVGSFNLLEAMRTAGVMRVVASSTAAIYGAPAAIPVDEIAPQQPLNPYGFSKCVVERMLDDYAAAYGLRFAALRYFNAAGAAADGTLGEDHCPETHLIPCLLQVALGQRDEAVIFGDDFPTPDGTCVRDYVHVEDLASAHLLALERLEAEPRLNLNVGTGAGYSVLEILDACRRVSGHPIPVRVVPRRPGDPPALIADPTSARRLLGWRPRYTAIELIVETAWRWHRARPRGFESSVYSEAS